jgi:hypothetical protein
VEVRQLLGVPCVWGPAQQQLESGRGQNIVQAAWDLVAEQRGVRETVSGFRPSRSLGCPSTAAGPWG